MEHIAQEVTLNENVKFVVLDDVEKLHKLGRYVIIICHDHNDGNEPHIDNFNLVINYPKEAIKLMTHLVDTFNYGYSGKPLIQNKVI